MTLFSYISLAETLEHDKSSVQQRRAFGLKYPQLASRPIEALLTWLDSALSKRSVLSDKMKHYLYRLTSVLVVIAFVFGFMSGVVLLSYHGEHPVNVVYFMAVVILLPLLSILLSIIAMGRASRFRATMGHLSNAYWLERLLRRLSSTLSFDMRELKINPRLTHWLILQRTQLLGIVFSIGVFLALVIVVVTQDIAFVWSSTLQVDAEAFHRVVMFVAIPWREWLPEAVPSVTLIEQSQYFRLGGGIKAEMVSSAALLGEWWKFLALSTLFYAIFLRLVFYFVVSLGVRSALKESFLSLAQVPKLLSDFYTPMVSTQASTTQAPYKEQIAQEIPSIVKAQSRYDTIQGWAFSQDEIVVMNDRLGIDAGSVFVVGGTQSLEEDDAVIEQSSGEVLLYVKGWEPPIMDFIDYLEVLASRVGSVVVYPIGMVRDGYQLKASDLKMWREKLSVYDLGNVELREI